MSARFHFRKFLMVAALLCLAPFLSAQDGLKGALSQANLAAPLGHTLAIADLDGDNQADGAILLDSQWVGTHKNIKIELHFTGRPNTQITFESTNQALTVRAWDIDHDGDNDLVVEDAFTHRPVRVWINEGHGDFHEGRVQDYPSLTVAGNRHLQLPSSRSNDLPLWISPQRSFDISLLTVHLWSRPPSLNRLLPAAIDLSATSQGNNPQSPRAPPFSS